MNGPLQRVSQALGRMRFPQLFLLLGGLFVLDLFVPDFVPFVDEIILFLLTAMVGRWEKERGEGPSPEKPPEKNVTPGR